MKYQVIGIIQARMGSTRLPGKTLIDICGKPLLEHILDRIQKSTKIDEFVIATTDNIEDNSIINFSARMGISCFCGSEEDVLDRYYQCARLHKADIIVRITADDPFKDPIVVDRVVCEILGSNYDYVSNTIHPTYPEGLDIEVFTFEALERSWREATTALDREHVTPYLWLHPDKFKIKNIEYEKNLSHMRWTLDTLEDLAFTREIYKKLYVPGKLFLMQDILNLLEENPEIQKLNANVERFSGHKKIIEEEG